MLFNEQKFNFHTTSLKYHPLPERNLWIKRCSVPLIISFSNVFFKKSHPAVSKYNISIFRGRKTFYSNVKKVIERAFLILLELSDKHWFWVYFFFPEVTQLLWLLNKWASVNQYQNHIFFVCYLLYFCMLSFFRSHE